MLVDTLFLFLFHMGCCRIRIAWRGFGCWLFDWGLSFRTARGRVGGFGGFGGMLDLRDTPLF